MLLTVSAFLCLIGFVAWTLGIVLEFQGVAAIGAVLVVGVGAAAMVDGLEVRDGQTESTNSTTNTTTISPDYQEVETMGSFPLGALFTLLGGVMVLRSMNLNAQA
jgi:hypothetical protein